MMITVEKLIKWEQLTKLPFTKLDSENLEHLDILLYINHIRANKTQTSLKNWQLIPLDSKSKRRYLESLAEELVFISQFQPEQKEAEEVKESEEENGIYIEDIANELMLNGVDSNYVMNCTMDMIPGLMRALSSKKREELENARLWSYFTILPHIDSKKIKSPSDLLPFPWEVEKDKVEKEKEHKEALGYAQGFLKV